MFHRHQSYNQERKSHYTQKSKINTGNILCSIQLNLKLTKTATKFTTSSPLEITKCFATTYSKPKFRDKHTFMQKSNKDYPVLVFV